MASWFNCNCWGGSSSRLSRERHSQHDQHTPRRSQRLLNDGDFDDLDPPPRSSRHAAKGSRSSALAARKGGKELNMLAHMSEEEKMRATRAFVDLDVDRNGALDYDEFAEGIASIMPHIRGGEINSLFKEVDFFGTGRITIDEFLLGMAMELEQLDTSRLRGHGRVAPPAGSGSPYEWEIDCRSELEVGDTIGEGSFAIVHCGSWRGTQVAIKMLKRPSEDGSLASDGFGSIGGARAQAHETRAMREEFQQEVATLGRLRHPNILLYLGACTHPEHMAIVTEFMPDGSLKALIARRQLSIHQILRMIHRDLKPANILVDRAGLNVKVADFGLATARTMVLRGDQYGASVDVFSFGVILWEMATGAPPFAGWELGQVVNFTLSRQRLAVPPSVPGPIRSAIEACWHQDPSRRPRMPDLVRALEQMQKQFST
eukprot:tig00000198_g16066.t1